MKPHSVTKEDVEKMKGLRASGWAYNKIADEFGVCRNTVRYHLREGEKEKCKKYAAKWKQLHRVQQNEYFRKWFAANRTKQYKAMCFSLMKRGLKDGFISMEEVYNILKEFHGESNA